MEKEPKIEELLNIISLQENALKYYADKKNYSGNIEQMNILKDRGHQARHVIKLAENIGNYQENMINQLKDAIKDADIDLNLEDMDSVDLETMKKLDQIKNIINSKNI